MSEADTSEGGSFNPAGVREFSFTDWTYLPERGELQLEYALDSLSFTERVVFPDAPQGKAPFEALERACQLAHWLAGISYFKAALPSRVKFYRGQPGPQCATLLSQVYRQGLGEMVWRSGLELPSATLFCAAAEPTHVPSVKGPNTDSAIVVPLGGGKDSLVTCDLLHQAGMAFRTIAVGQSPLIVAMAERLQKCGVSQGHIQISRTLDPQLINLNKAGAHNGHVPITGVLAGLMLVAGVVYGFDTIVMSNERSADAANLHLEDGQAINHQYSKGAEFETAFQSAVTAEVLQGFRYFSLLRGSSEIAIARHFSTLNQWFSDFSSCNQNFRQDGLAPNARWCGHCPKCRFVFLALAPTLGPAKLVEIFGTNLLDEDCQTPGYRALCGLAEHKPFECVGEVEESAALMKRLSEQPSWQQCRVVNRLGQQVAKAASLDQFYSTSIPNSVPPQFTEALSRL
ncbi:MAG: endonuclease domain-containing protein [Lysobacterales bacterium]